MGGGFVTRPEFGCRQPDPSHPLTEFYCILQNALNKEPVFQLPPLYARFKAPARRIYRDEADTFCSVSSVPKDGFSQLLDVSSMNVLYSEIAASPSGAPAALVLTEECSRRTCAVQLLPPFLWEEALPPLPETGSSLTLQLTENDLSAADADPSALGAKLISSSAGKKWLRHPLLDRWISEKTVLLQRVYRR